jgi:signal peptidase I
MEPAYPPIAIGRDRARPGRRALKAIALAAALALVAGWVVLLRPTALGGPATYVIVSGMSMRPSLQPGDLVVAFERDAYAVGDVVVFAVPTAEAGGGTHIVHRIVDGSPRTGFLVKGDNRESADHWRPTAEEIKGQMQLSVPHVGTVLAFLRGPVGTALIAGVISFLLVLWVFAGSGAEARPRER